MAAKSTTFHFSILLSLYLLSLFGVEGEIPPTCKRYECPQYDVIETGNEYEIRRYISPVLISTAPYQTSSLVIATEKGFTRLFNYIYGDNNYKKQIEMTAPVISEVSNSSIVVSFFVPKKNQVDPPPADDLKVQRWKTRYVAVRQFGGFVTNSNVGKQVAALNASIAHTKWSAAVPKSYIVAQYNAPIELINRVNEIWFLYE